jgi:hypothetical protein
MGKLIATTQMTYAKEFNASSGGVRVVATATLPTVRRNCRRGQCQIMAVVQSAQTPARVNVTCVTPLGEDVAST